MTHHSLRDRRWGVWPALALLVAWGIPGALSPPEAVAAVTKNVVLLISLDPAFYPKGIAAWFHHYKGYPRKLQATFTREMDLPGYHVVIKNDADSYDLYQALHSRENAAVFWVSHEAPAHWSKTPGIAIQPLLVDYEGADVKNVFTEISPTIRWVSLVACDSNQVINWLNSQEAAGGAADQGTERQIQGFPKTIDANKGLQRAIRKSLAILSKPAPAEASPDSAHPPGSMASTTVRMTRQLSAVGASQARIFPSLLIELQGKIVGAFPQAILKPGEQQSAEQQIELTEEELSHGAASLTITLDSGFDEAALPAGFGMGTFSAVAEPSDTSGGTPALSWRVFAQSNGIPFGVTQQTLLLAEH